MAQDKIKYGSKKFKKMLNELYKEATELSNDHNCKVGIFVTPKEKDKNSKIYASGSPSMESVVEELEANAKAERMKRKKLRATFSATPVCGCKLGGEDANVMHEGK
ncbi:uncharacterized protein LOC131302679 [Rhododendron vialii]|uniref:uncharacterized protein LOC131302679 n=1 Tax=Rhododendron vialii TaxID=182163 RepID=UPI00265F50DE|nr:uncharacterized protein LOC131302679 [Rhododendron vialii]